MPDQQDPQQMISTMRALQIEAQKPKYQVVETTNLRDGSKSYRIFMRGNNVMSLAAIETGIATLEQAEARMRELEEKLREAKL
jgi:hypothetical protein